MVIWLGTFAKTSTERFPAGLATVVSNKPTSLISQQLGGYSIWVRFRFWLGIYGDESLKPAFMCGVRFHEYIIDRKGNMYGDM